MDYCTMSEAFEEEEFDDFSFFNKDLAETNKDETEKESLGSLMDNSLIIDDKDLFTNTTTINDVMDHDYCVYEYINFSPNKKVVSHIKSCSYCKNKIKKHNQTITPKTKEKEDNTMKYLLIGAVVIICLLLLINIVVSSRK